MNNKELFIKAIGTLFFSWGSDTPPEVYWGCNQLLEWYENEYGVTLNIRFEIGNYDDEDNYDEVIESIRNS